MIRAAAVEKDLDDVKAAFLMYVKACPDVTYVEMEQMFRNENIGVYLIGVERTDLSVTLTNMDLQGNLDRKYTITFRFQDKPSRPREKTIWPANTEENLTRLAEGGEPVARGIPLCMNCRELGHTSRICPTERIENTEQAAVACHNCGSEGHRLRDCKTQFPFSLLPLPHHSITRQALTDTFSRQGSPRRQVRVPQLWTERP